MQSCIVSFECDISLKFLGLTVCVISKCQQPSVRMMFTYCLVKTIVLGIISEVLDYRNVSLKSFNFANHDDEIFSYKHEADSE